MTTKRNQAVANAANIQDAGSLTEIENLFDDIEVKLIGLTKELRDAQRVQAMMFRVDQREMKYSPAPSDAGSLNIKTEDMESLRRNYVVVNELMDVLSMLDTAEAKLLAAFPEGSSGTKDALKHSQALRKSTLDKLNEAYAFIRNLAQGHIPAFFDKFVEAVNRIVEKSIVYMRSTSYVYLHEVAGVPVFSHYLMLEDCIDEDGTTFPKLFIVTSARIVKPAELFITTLQDFEAPSGKLLLREVKTAQEVVRVLHQILLMDSFSNNIGSLPLPLLLKPSDIRLKMFNAAEHIKAFEVDEVTGNLVFHLKATVQDEILIAKVIAQLEVDVKAILDRTSAKLRVRRKDWGKHWVVTFYMIKPSNTPHALPEDFRYIQERFGLDEVKVKKILQVINANVFNSSRAPAVSPAKVKAGLSNAALKQEGVRLIHLAKMASGVKNWDQEGQTKIQMDRAKDPGMMFLRIKQNIASNLNAAGTHMGNGVHWYVDGDDATLQFSVVLKDSVVTVSYLID